MKTGLQLHHHSTHRKFVLLREGDEWREEFDTLAAAMAVAAQMLDGAIPLLVLDEVGKVVSESTIHTALFRHDDSPARE